MPYTGDILWHTAGRCQSLYPNLLTSSSERMLTRDTLTTEQRTPVAYLCTVLSRSSPDTYNPYVQEPEWMVQSRAGSLRAQPKRDSQMPTEDLRDTLQIALVFSEKVDECQTHAA